MTWRSSIPAAMDALAAVAGTTGSRVVMGPVFSDSAMQPTLVIGWGGVGQDAPMVTATSALDGYVTNPTHEHYAISCVAVADSGSTSAESVSATRDAALDLFGAAADAVASDKTLGGVVMLAAVADYSLTIQQTARGVTAYVEFSVTVDAQSRKESP